jgi:catechol-2,3-dioxygenase
MYHPSFLAVGLVVHEDSATDRFDERAVGLDHLALRVPNRAALDAIIATTTTTPIAA